MFTFGVIRLTKSLGFLEFFFVAGGGVRGGGVWDSVGRGAL